MANRFRTANLVLGGNLLTTTGDLLYNNGVLIGTGTYYPIGNPDNYSSSGNVESTGTALQTQIATERNKNALTGISVSGGIGITGSINLNAGSNITLTQVGADSVTIASTAAAGSSYAGVTGLIVTGSVAVSGNILITGNSGIKTTLQGNQIIIGIEDSNLTTLTGAGNVTVFTSGSYLWISGATGFLSDYYRINNPNNFISSGDVSSTYYLITNPNNFVKSGEFISGISITGGIAIQGELNINAGNNITLTQIGSNAFSIASNGVGGSSYDGVTGLNITGSSAISGNVIITGGGATTTLLSGNTLIITTPSSAGGGEANTASNLGDGIGLFNDKNGVDLRFLSVTGGSGISVSRSGNQITINNDWVSRGYVVSTHTTTNTGIVTGLSFYIGANEIWSADFHLGMRAGGVAGAVAGISGPSGVLVSGYANGSLSIPPLITSTGIALSATPLLNGSAGGVSMHVLIKNSTETGLIECLYGSANGVVTASVIGGGSYFEARRIL